MKEIKEKLIKIKKNRNYNISNNWLIGFIEAEGSFISGKQPSLQISQHSADKELLISISKYLDSGKVRINKRKDERSIAILTINDKIVLKNKIIPLISNKLLTNKKILQFYKWKRDNFQLKEKEIKNKVINFEWLVGFTDGDGSFYPIIHKAKDYKYGYQVQLIFDIAQEKGERELLEKIGKNFFNNTHKWAKSDNTEHMRISKLSALIEYVEPFYINNNLQSRKIYDFIIWQEILKMMIYKKHLTLEGVNKIRELVLLQRYYRLN